MQILVGLQNAIDLQQALAPGAVTTTEAGPTLDVAPDLGPINFIIDFGPVSGTNPSLTYQAEESSDGGTSWAIIPGTSSATVTSNVSGTIQSLQAKNNYNKVRLNITAMAGTTPSFTMGAELIAQQRHGTQGANQSAGYSNYPASAT